MVKYVRLCIKLSAKQIRHNEYAFAAKIKIFAICFAIKIKMFL